MREIGTFEEERRARTFGDLLLVRGIENSLREGEEGVWGVWVHDEDRLGEAVAILDQFRKDPDRPEYTRCAGRADAVRAERRKELERYTRRMRASRIRWRSMGVAGIGRVTLVLILISVVVGLVSGLGSNTDVVRRLTIADYRVTGNLIRWHGGLADVYAGQFWRLVTPIFLHFGFLHILFNMWWLKDLGSQIEDRQSPATLLALVLVIAAVSNVAQYEVSGPVFGGMSGVVYGLLGYIWMRGKHDPASGLFLDRNIVIFMLVWFVLCLTGLVGNVANIVHGAGLLIGVAWGYLSAQAARSARRS